MPPWRVHMINLQSLHLLLIYLRMN